MLKPALLFLVVYLLISSCSTEIKDTKEQGIETETEKERSEVKEDQLIYSDTTHTFSDVGEFYSFERKIEDTLISIKGKKYRLRLECQLDQNKRLIHNESYPDKTVLHQYTTVGYQAHFEISLFDKETLVFKSKLTKEDFKEAYYGLVLESGAHLPQFVQYNKAFNSLVFQVPFYINDSDVMCDALLVIGMNGKTKIVDHLSSASGNSANHNVQITPNQLYLLSRNSIYSPDGNSVDFAENSKSNLLGTDLFDDCILVVYEFDKTTHPKNAYLKDYSGKTLLNFKYEGWTGALGYSFLREKVKNAFYFIDEQNKRLIQVEKVNNKWIYVNLPFSGMSEFDGNQQATEHLLDLSTEITDFIFYLDTTSGKIRKITPPE